MNYSKRMRIKNKILKGITWIAVYTALLSAAAFDSFSVLPKITLIISFMWIALFAWANDKFL